MVRARFAPSPTGNLHIGSARTLIFNWLYVRKHRGTMILTINDTDVDRNTEASLQLAERIEAAPEFTEHSVEANLRKLAEERVIRRLRGV